jgi:hypothetical protein
MRFCLWKAAAVSAVRNGVKQMEAGEPSAEKTLKLNTRCLRSFRFAPRSIFTAESGMNAGSIHLNAMLAPLITMAGVG